MSKLLSTLLFFVLFYSAFGQSVEKGYLAKVELKAGHSHFLGDISNRFFKNRPAASFFPAVDVGIAKQFSNRFGWKVNGSFVQVAAQDPPIKGYDGTLFRAWRNLDFKSHIISIDYLIFFRGGKSRDSVKSSEYRFYAGLGFFYFNPKTLDGMALHPLSTEGQGLMAYPDRAPYSRIAVNLPIAFQVVWHRPRFSYGFFIEFNFTTTDYIDDVSKSYADPNHYPEGHPYPKYYESHRPATGNWGRSSTNPREQRGDPTDFDQWFKVGFVFVLPEGIEL